MRQSWGAILSAESLDREAEWRNSFSGTGPALLKWAVVRFLGLWFRILLGLKVRGLERLPHGGPYLLCPNHLSYLDALVMLARLPYRVLQRVFFVGDSSFFASPFMRLVAWVANVFPVDPDAHLLRAMKAGAHGLRSGRILGIFPEGSRSFDGRLGEFKKGAAILARELNVPMVPVAIRGTYEVWPRDRLRIRLHKVTVEFGAPIYPGAELRDDPYGADTERLREAVSALIGHN